MRVIRVGRSTFNFDIMKFMYNLYINFYIVRHHNSIRSFFFFWTLYFKIILNLTITEKLYFIVFDFSINSVCCNSVLNVYSFANSYK